MRNPFVAQASSLILEYVHTGRSLKKEESTSQATAYKSHVM